MADESKIDSTQGFSLADLAGMNTDAVATLTSLLPAVGVYTVRGLDIKAGRNEGQDGKPPLFFFTFSSEILDAKLVDKNIDVEALVAAKRKLSDSFTLWPNQFQDMIGLLKGRYKTIGLPNTGERLGGVEGQPPGWLDGIVNYVYKVKVTHHVNKGDTRARFTYMKQDDSGDEAATA